MLQDGAVVANSSLLTAHSVKLNWLPTSWPDNCLLNTLRRFGAIHPW